jgi:uncharacterized protein (DUF849 family)
MPENVVMGVVSTGASQFPFFTMAMILVCHVRVGMEDAFYIEKVNWLKAMRNWLKKLFVSQKSLADLSQRPF